MGTYDHLRTDGVAHVNRVLVDEDLEHVLSNSRKSLWKRVA